MSKSPNEGGRWILPTFIVSALIACAACVFAAIELGGQQAVSVDDASAAIEETVAKDVEAKGDVSEAKPSRDGMKSAPAETKDDDEKWTGGKETVDLSSRMGPGISIFDLITAGELIPEEPTPETENPEEAKEFPSVWTGSFEGFDSDGNPEHKDVEMKFDEVNAAGYIKGVCTIDSHDMGPDAVEGSYTVEGFVNWETDNVELWGTSWVEKGEIDVMRHYYGTLNSSYTAIQGSCATLEGKGETKWTMVAD